MRQGVSGHLGHPTPFLATNVILHRHRLGNAVERKRAPAQVCSAELGKGVNLAAQPSGSPSGQREVSIDAARLVLSRKILCLNCLTIFPVAHVKDCLSLAALLIHNVSFRSLQRSMPRNRRSNGTSMFPLATHPKKIWADCPLPGQAN